MEGLFAQARKAGLDMDALGEQLAARKQRADRDLQGERNSRARADDDGRSVASEHVPDRAWSGRRWHRRPTSRAFFDEATNTVSYLVADPATASRRSSTRCSTSIPPAARSIPLRSMPCWRSRPSRASTIRLGARDARACRPSVGRERHQGAHWRRDRRSATALARSSARSPLVASAMSTRESDFDRLLDDGDTTAARRAGNRGMATPGHTPGLRHLPDRRRGLCRRYFVHARLWHCADRFPGRRCAPALSVDAAHPRAAARDPAVHVPRLQGARTRRVCVGDDGRRTDRPQRPHWRRRGEDDYVAMREARDATLAVPKLLYPSIQVNIRAGQLPQAEAGGMHFLKFRSASRTALYF